MSAERIFFGIIGLLSVFVLPWWGTFCILFVLLFRFTPYYEGFFLGLLLDSLYSIAPGFGYTFTFWTTVCFFITLLVKERLRIA